MNLLTDIQYFGSINYIKILFQFSNIEIEQYESYQKMSFRNRTRIAGSNGLVDLSVPLEQGRSQKRLMKDVRISYADRWQQQHWRTIESCYASAPFFEYYQEGVYRLFQKKETFLLDLDLATLEWVRENLKKDWQVSLTETYCKKEELVGAIDLRGQFSPRSTATSNEPCVKYTQVFEDRIGFQPNLSIIDLLFCCGPGTRELLSPQTTTR